jgi:hypothetical protein
LVSVLLLAAALTTHNALSLVLIVLLLGYVSIGIVDVRRGFTYIGFASVTTTYFWLPFFTDISSTYASEVAQLTRYQEHFLCIGQLWTGIWGFAGSAPGCVYDGQAFMLGKIGIVLAMIGIVVWISRSQKSTPISSMRQGVFVCIFTLGSLWLTHESSYVVWSWIKPLRSFQFPWRFLVFVLCGVAFFASYSIEWLKVKIRRMTVLLLGVCILGMSYKFFTPLPLATSAASDREGALYIQTHAAYKVPEYLPRTIDRAWWMKLEGTVLSTSEQARLKDGMRAYKPKLFLYTIADILSGVSFLFLACHTIYTRIQKKA